MFHLLFLMSIHIPVLGKQVLVHIQVLLECCDDKYFYIFKYLFIFKYSYFSAVMISTCIYSSTCTGSSTLTPVL